MIARTDVVKKLKNVRDPELGFDIVEMGLIYDVVPSDDTLTIRFTLTYPGCPFGPIIIDEIKKRIAEIPNAPEPSIELVWSPAWSKAMMSPDTLEELNWAGRGK